MHGYRKLIIALVAIGGALLVPLNEPQANVIIYVSGAMILGNSAKGIGDKIAEAIARRNSDGDSSDSDSAGAA